MVANSGFGDVIGIIKQIESGQNLVDAAVEIGALAETGVINLFMAEGRMGIGLNPRSVLFVRSQKILESI